jgi:hypothetical protein
MMWTDGRGNFSPVETLTCDQRVDTTPKWTPGPWTVDDIEAFVDLYAACSFVEEFLSKLEGDETDDMLYRMRQHFHAPLHAVLRPALAKARGEKS